VLSMTLTVDAKRLPTTASGLPSLLKSASSREKG
jgi:hypothetical protein